MDKYIIINREEDLDKLIAVELTSVAMQYYGKDIRGTYEEILRMLRKLSEKRD